MKASRRNKSQDNPFAHLEEGKTIAHPGARDKTSRKTPVDIAFAIKFALTRGPRAVAKFRGSQQRILRAISKSLSPGNTWILTHADCPTHVRDTNPNVHVLLLCAFADSTRTDFNLGRDFLYGFQLTGVVESSMMHREIPRPEPIAFATACHELEKSAWPSLIALAKSITDNHHHTPPLDRAELVTVTDSQVKDGKLAGPFTQHELFQRLYDRDPLPKKLPDGSVRAPVCSLRFGVRQGLKLRPCEDWQSNHQNECTSLGETIAPISLDEPALLAEEIMAKATELGVSPPHLSIAMDDVQGGYDNLPADKEYVMCLWHEPSSSVKFYVSKVLMFGSTASVTHF
jgi:hypothetical protein